MEIVIRHSRQLHGSLTVAQALGITADGASITATAATAATAPTVYFPLLAIVQHYHVELDPKADW